MLVTIQNDTDGPRQVAVALLPSSSDEDGELEQTVHDVTAGDTVSVTVAEGRYVRIVEIPPTE